MFRKMLPGTYWSFYVQERRDFRTDAWILIEGYPFRSKKKIVLKKIQFLVKTT